VLSEVLNKIGRCASRVVFVFADNCGRTSSLVTVLVSEGIANVLIVYVYVKLFVVKTNVSVLHDFAIPAVLKGALTNLALYEVGGVVSGVMKVI
jgi:hypothetical protein